MDSSTIKAYSFLIVTVVSTIFVNGHSNASPYGSQHGGTPAHHQQQQQQQQQRPQHGQGWNNQGHQQQQQPGGGNHHPHGAHHSFGAAEDLKDKEHIKSHLEGEINVGDESEWSMDKVKFYYFKMFDQSHDNLLDGLEIFHAIKHSDEEHINSTAAAAATNQTNQHPDQTNHQHQQQHQHNTGTGSQSGQQQAQQGGDQEAEMTEDEVEAQTDKILADMDQDMDGFINWAEFNEYVDKMGLDGSGPPENGANKP